MDAAIETWLRTFERAVHERDYATARELFMPDAFCFGTVATATYGMDALVKEQWEKVWPFTSGFRFIASSYLCGSADFATVTTAWASTRDANGSRRTGRATIVLEQTSYGWRAVHTHFSLTPPEENAP